MSNYKSLEREHMTKISVKAHKVTGNLGWLNRSSSVIWKGISSSEVLWNTGWQRSKVVNVLGVGGNKALCKGTIFTVQEKHVNFDKSHKSFMQW